MLSHGRIRDKVVPDDKSSYICLIAVIQCGLFIQLLS